MVTRVFRRYADRAGLSERLTLHDLRYSAKASAALSRRLVQHIIPDNAGSRSATQ
jgi:hypothetical protein